MQLFPTGKNSGLNQGESESFPKVELPHGVAVMVEEIDRAVKPGWFGRNLDGVYKAHIKTILPIQEDFPKDASGSLYASPSDYLQLVHITLKDAVTAALAAPPDFSAKFRKLFGWHEEHHHLAELASVAVDFSHRMRRHGKVSEALELSNDALMLAMRHRDPFLHARAHYEFGTAIGIAGRYEDASAHFSVMLKSMGSLLENHPDCMHWALPRLPRVIDHVLLHSFPEHDPDARDLLSHSYLLLKVLLTNRHFILACCDSAVVAPATVAAARAAGALGKVDDVAQFANQACIAASGNGDPMLVCSTAIQLAEVFLERREAESALRIVLNAAAAAEPLLVPPGTKPNLEVIRRFGELMDIVGTVYLELGNAGAMIAALEKRDQIYKRYKIALPDDGAEPDPELV